MGQDHGKNLESKRDDYFQEQLRLYRWRADPTQNLHLARVHFTSKNRLLGRNKLHNIVQQQLSTQNYVDLKDISSLAKEQIWKEAEEVMTFQTYCATLASLQEQLNFQEMLYVFKVMLSGYETIFRKYGKLHISADCCFLTQKGELRVWINPNPISNELPEDRTTFVGETCSINQLLKICKELTFDRRAFSEFHRQLRAFLDRDLLHNTGFSSLRKFINGYAYSHRVFVPQNLEKIIKNIKSEPSSLNPTLKSSPLSTPKHRHSSSLSEIADSDWYSRVRMLSTDANLMNGKQTSFEEMSESSLDQAESKKLHFYRPNQNYEQKLSTFDLNSCQQVNSGKHSSKKSGKMSLSSSFSKKNKEEYSEVYMPTTPKNNCRTRTGLQSTSGESFLYHSKDPSGLAGSKLATSNSTSNFFENRNQPIVRFQKKENRVCEQDLEWNKKLQYNQIRQEHSRQPSFDQNSSSLFVSPASELQYHSSQAYKQPDLSKIEVVPEAERSEDGSAGGSLTTKGRITPSQLLTRQVSGLVQNEEINMFQSRGSFLSIDNSNTSEYKGILNGLCRSAKMLHIATRKQIEKRNSRRQSNALHIS